MKQEDKFNKILRETTKQYDATLRALSSGEAEEDDNDKKLKIEEIEERSDC